MLAEQYNQLICKVGQKCYYLWGPIYNALLIELVDHKNDQLIRDLILYTPSDMTEEDLLLKRDLINNVLINAFYSNHETVHNILLELSKYISINKNNYNRKAITEAKKIVADVASQQCLTDLLIQQMDDSDEESRRYAVRSAFFLWQREKQIEGIETNHVSGWKIFEDLGSVAHISQWIFPSRFRLKSCYELSLSVLFEDYANQEVTNHLRIVWSEIVNKLMMADTRLENKYLQKVIPYFRTSILRFVTNIALGIVKDMDKDKMSVVSTDEFKQFFKLSREEKDYFRDMCSYIDPRDKEFNNSKTQLLKLAKTRDVLYSYLYLVLLETRFLMESNLGIDFVVEIVNEIIKTEPALPAIPMSIIYLSNFSDGKEAGEIDEEILNAEGLIIKNYHNLHRSICEGITGRRFLYSGMSSYPQYLKKKHGKVDEDLLSFFVEKMKAPINKNAYDYDLIRSYIINVVVPGHPKYRDLRAILECLSPIVEIARDPETILLIDGNDVDHTKSKEMLFSDLSRALASIQVYSPELVENFMNEEHLPEDFIDQVKRKSSEEIMASAVIGRAVFFIRDVVLGNPSGTLFQLFKKWFRSAPDYPNLAEWVSYLIALTLNELSGKALFHERWERN